jgi:hypothetical protein
LTSERVRKFAMENLPHLEEKARAKGITIVSNDHLDPAHKAIMILDAPSAETARDLVMEAGFMHFTQMEFYMVTPVAELVAKADQFPTIY